MAGPACAIALGTLIVGMASSAPGAQVDDDPPLAAAAAASAPAPAGDRSTVNAAAMSGRRRAEQDEMARQDAAAGLAQLGVTVDWRAFSLEKLVDMRLRANKAAELRAQFDVIVDWRRHSWVELEAMREMLLRFQRAKPAAAAAPAAAAVSPAGGADDVMRPTFAWRPRPEHANADPDGVITPTFSWHPVAHRGSVDSEDVIAPSFAPFRRRVRHVPADADDLIEP